MLRKIGKKAMALMFAFALSVTALFSYAPLTTEAAPGDLAIGFVKNHTITRPYYHAITIVENKDNGDYRVTKMLVQAEYRMAGYVNDNNAIPYFGLSIAKTTSATPLYNLIDNTDTLQGVTRDDFDMLLYDSTTYSSDHQILEQNIGIDAFKDQWTGTRYFYMNFYENNNYSVYSNAYTFTNISDTNEYLRMQNINSDNPVDLSTVCENSIIVSMNNTVLFDYNNFASSTQIAPTSFNVDASLIGEGALVTIPANMDLVYDEASGNYVAGDYISARGHVLDIAEVIVSTAKTATYLLDGTNKEYEANVSFGTEENDKNVAVWSAADLKQGYTNAENSIKKAIGISLPGENITWTGEYKSNMEVSVGYNIAGLYRDICAPTTGDNGYTVYFCMEKDMSTIGNSKLRTFLCNLGDEIENVNLSGLSVTVTPESGKSSVSSSVEVYIVPKGDEYTIDTESNNAVKKMQLTKGNGKTFYSATLFDESNPSSLVSWAEDFPNLHILVIPEDVSSSQVTSGVTIHSTLGTPQSKVSNVDYTNTCFTGTNTVIGNALSFVKGKTEGGFYTYIPYIVYRGTMDEWKALSGSEDWVFGNAANAVTVQCTDGRLLYN